MKNRSLFSTGLILLIALSFTFVATSCSWFGGGENDVVFESNIQEKRVGTLKSLGGMSVGEGTHLLEMEDRSTMRLRGLNIDLDNERYLSKKVEVRGPIAQTTDGKELMDVQSIDLAEDEEVLETATGVETDYNNAKLGIHLTYLDSWELSEEDTRILFTAPQGKAVVEETAPVDEESTITETEKETKQDVVIIERIPNPQKKSLEMFLQLPSDNTELLNLGYNQTLVGTDHLDGLKKESGDRYEIDVWLTRGEYVYQFTFLGSEHMDVAKNRNTFFSMIASFKFIGILESDEEETTTDDSVEAVETSSTTETKVEEADTVNDIVEETPVVKKETATLPKVIEDVPTTSSSVYTQIAKYVGQEINTLAPESSDNGSWKAYSFEFADPNYVYADYSDGTDYRRILVSYDHDGTSFDTNVEAYFQPGETTSWERVSGENPVENAEKTVVAVTESGATQSAIVKEGYRYFESLPYDFLAQYPSNWYFSGTSGGGDVLHHYGFSNEPVENGNELVSIDIISGSAPAGSSISIGSNTGTKVYENGEVSIYITRSDGTLYKIHGGSGQESSVIDIAASITAS